MHPSHFAQSHPDKLALILPDSGEQLTYAELDTAANRAAHLYRSAGLKRGDTVAMLAENCIDFYVAWWGAQRTGLYFNCLPTDVLADETAYVINDCAAAALIVSATLESTAGLLQDAASAMPGVRALYSLNGRLPGTAQDWREALAAMPATPIADTAAGAVLSYSSGSTGRPKGMRQPLPPSAFDAHDRLTDMWVEHFGYREDSVYIAPGPLAYSFTLVFAAIAQRVGATVVQMTHFDPIRFLSLVETYRGSLAAMTPPMFVRLLKLPAPARDCFDVSSLRSIVHAATPCAPVIKRAMIEWWGPILHELYSGTEGVGAATISAQEWLERPSSVGRPLWGLPHICDDEGGELAPGQTGVIYFESPSGIRATRHPVHKTWATYGDIGRLDTDGYLYVTDRAAFAVLGEGHRLYPQQTEDVLIAHPRVADGAVFGVPNRARGQRLVAVVQPLEADAAGPELAEALIAWCRVHLSSEQCPATIEFTPALARRESGKLNKRLVRDGYLAMQSPSRATDTENEPLPINSDDNG